MAVYVNKITGEIMEGFDIPGMEAEWDYVGDSFDPNDVKKLIADAESQTAIAMANHSGPTYQGPPVQDENYIPSALELKNIIRAKKDAEAKLEIKDHIPKIMEQLMSSEKMNIEYDISSISNDGKDLLERLYIDKGYYVVTKSDRKILKICLDEEKETSVPSVETPSVTEIAKKLENLSKILKNPKTRSIKKS